MELRDLYVNTYFIYNIFNKNNIKNIYCLILFTGSYLYMFLFYVQSIAATAEDKYILGISLYHNRCISKYNSYAKQIFLSIHRFTNIETVTKIDDAYAVSNVGKPTKTSTVLQNYISNEHRSTFQNVFFKLKLCLNIPYSLYVGNDTCSNL